MKIVVEFESWEEMEQFRVSGKKTRGKGAKEEVEEQVEPTAASTPQTFAPSAAATQPQQGFPGGNSGAPAAAATSPLVTAILARIDGAISSGQPADNVVTWFRQQIGPEAANATLEQIKQIFVPRMTEQQLKQIAPQLGITA